MRKATDFEAEQLNLEKGDPVAVAEQIGYVDTGDAFEIPSRFIVMMSIPLKLT